MPGKHLITKVHLENVLINLGTLEKYSHGANKSTNYFNTTQLYHFFMHKVNIKGAIFYFSSCLTIK